MATVLDAIRTVAPEGSGLMRTHRASADDLEAALEGLGAFAAEPMAFVALFASPEADFAGLMAGAAERLPETQVIGCTTAGEIAPGTGYDEGSIVAVGFPASHFAARTMFIDKLDSLDEQALIDRIIRNRVALTDSAPDMADGFAFLMVDGLSLKEDMLAASMSPALAEMPLFGGSAGDGTDFGRTLVAGQGKVGENCAVLTLVRSRCEVKVFTINHLEPDQTRMVVTEADPDRRIVKEINAEPAAREYARIVGKDPNQLDPFIFASHPVVVRIGDQHHVRSIQRVNKDGDLVFFSAIDEGMVLRVAHAMDMAEHLEFRLSELSQDGAPAAILGCDCILRRIEALQSQQTGAISKILASHNVTGFSTYGEQIGPLHVNHTMAGVAIYPPKAAE